MKRTLVKIALVVGGVVAAAVIVFGGGVAIAERALGPGAMHHRMQKFIAGAVDAAKPDAAQKKQLEAIRERTMSQMRGMHMGRRGDVQQALALFEADTLDGAKVEQMKSARMAEMQKAGDTMVAALTEVHDVLRPDQRKAVADYLRANKPSHEPGFRGRMMKRMATARIDNLLDEVDANPAQRTAILAARDHVFSVLDENLATIDAGLVDKALKLFEADKIDAAQVAAMRADHQARVAKVGDAIVQAIHDVHDALTPAQRGQVVDTIRDHMARFEQHHGRHGVDGTGPVDATGQ